MTSASARANGRAATTRSCARFIFDVATISIVRVIFRVFSTLLIRPLSSRPLAMGSRPPAGCVPRTTVRPYDRMTVNAVHGNTVVRSYGHTMHSHHHSFAAVKEGEPL